MFTLSLVRRSTAGGGGDEAGFEDREFGLVQDSPDLHCLLPSAKTEARWGNNIDFGYINYLCFLVCETKVV